MHGKHEGGDGETREIRRRRREKCEYYEEEHKRDDDGKGTASKGRVRRGGKIDLEQTRRVTGEEERDRREVTELREEQRGEHEATHGKYGREVSNSISAGTERIFAHRSRKGDVF